MVGLPPCGPRASTPVPELAKPCGLGEVEMTVLWGMLHAGVSTSPNGTFGELSNRQSPRITPTQVRRSLSMSKGRCFDFTKPHAAW